METKKDRHRTVRCKVCSKSMRSDHLERHTKKHEDILAMSDDNVREELRARHSAHLLREERQQVVEEIAQQENIPIRVLQKFNYVDRVTSIVTRKDVAR